jgi:integrase
MGLSDLMVKKFKPRSSYFEVGDSAGLYIRVNPGGKKTWVFRYQFNGVPRHMSIGGYPGISLAEARVKHGQALQDIEHGIDPGRKALEEKRKLRAAPSMANLVDELWETELKEKRSGPETYRLLKKDVVAVWQNRQVRDIKRRDIVLLLDGIAKRAPIIRNRVHSALTRLFNFAAERGVIEDSPCTRIRKPAEQSRTRVLLDDEIKALWRGLDLENKEIDMFLATKMALKMVLLTGQRSSEICGMTWAEIDLEKKVWTIPASRMKNKTRHTLPLAEMAMAVIEKSRSIFGDKSPFVFASPRLDARVMTHHALSRAISRHWKEMKIKETFSPHDIRRTVRTRLAELKVQEFIAERVLGHKLDGMLSVYNLHDYLPEKREALELWERRLKAIVGIGEAKKRGKVISIKSGRR